MHVNMHINTHTHMHSRTHTRACMYAHENNRKGRITSIKKAVTGLSAQVFAYEPISPHRQIKNMGFFVDVYGFFCG